MNGNGTSRLLLAAFFTGYVALIAIVVLTMSAWRQNVVTAMSAEDSQKSWNKWRAEAAQQDGSRGPVQRTAPKSPEPPLLVLMRDYFPACLAGLLVPLSALYVVIVWMACGVMRQSRNDTACKAPSN